MRRTEEAEMKGPNGRTEMKSAMSARIVSVGKVKFYAPQPGLWVDEACGGYTVDVDEG